MKKFLTLFLATVMTVAASVTVFGCGGKVVDDIDPNKTQLYIGNYNGGGTEVWLDKAAEEFAERYKDEHFEDGKTGVQFVISHDKGFDGMSLASNIATDNNEIYFSNNIYYQDYVANGYTKDITHLVTEVTNEDDGKKIVDKLYSSDVTDLKVNGKYYGLPYYELTSGLSYDAGIFATKNLYFSNEIDASDSTYPGTRKFISINNKTKSCGPDGVVGTYDDGLPSSIHEFYKLIDKMKQEANVTPFVYHPGHYTNQLVASLYVNLLGSVGTKAVASMDTNGQTVEIVKSINNNGTLNTEEVAITKDNAYLLKETSALYYALEFAQKVFTKDPKYVDSRSYSSTFSHLNAMEALLYSGIDGKNNHIGMLIEGNYWYNEADDDGMFERFESTFPDTYKTKDIKFMPLPRQYDGTVEEGKGSAPVFAETYHAYTIVNANASDAKMPLIEKFLSFLYSEQKLRDYTVNTNGIRIGVQYDYASTRDNLHSFAQSIMDMRVAAETAGTYVKVKSSNENKIYATAEKEFALTSISTFWQSGVYTTPCAAFQSGATVKDYFEGMSNEAAWAEKLK